MLNYDGEMKAGENWMSTETWWVYAVAKRQRELQRRRLHNNQGHISLDWTTSTVGTSCDS